MRLPELCIRKPVLAMVFSLVLVVLGVLGFQHLEIRFFPRIEVPVVSIYTYYEGASANLMESQVTTIIENYLAGIDGVQYISSESWNSGSWITVQFRLGGDLESEAAQVRDKVSAAVQYLPTDANVPSVTVGGDDNPILGVGFLDKKKKPADIRDYILRNIQPVLRQLPGVGYVSVLGSSGYAMRVWLDPATMAATGISVDNVKNAITSNNIYFPAGQIHGATRNYSVVSDTKLKNPEEFANIIVKQTPNGTIRLRDIARVNIGLQSLYDFPMRIDGQNGIMVMVDPLQAANPINVAQEVRKALNTIEAKLPPGMVAKLQFDMSQFLKHSIYETFQSIGEAVILVIIVVFLFLGSLRAASIPIITIPVSLITVFAIIDYLGFTINMMSLLGMVLAIGLVVDDAIVMLENIHRHIEDGMSPMEAALRGSKEIGFAIVAMSLTLVAVYAPVGFIEGYTAELFKEFAFTLAGAVVVSGFVALTLSPMMCSRILTSEAKESRMALFLDKSFDKMALVYRHFLSGMLKARLLVVAGLVVVGVFGYFLYANMNSEFIPQEDYGTMNISIVSPTGASIGYTEKYTAMIEKILRKIPLIQDFSTQVSVTSTMLRVEMKPWGKERHVTTQSVVSQLNKQLKRIPGVVATASIPDVVNVGNNGSDIELNFMTTQDYSVLLGPMNKLVGMLRQYPGLLNVQSDLKFDSQQYAISFNRDLAATVGVSLQDIADTVHALMSGIHLTDVTSGSQSYQVLVQMERGYLKSLDAVDAIYLPSNPPFASSSSKSAPAGSPAGFSNMVPLSTLVNLTPTIGQGTLDHFDRMRSGTITALVAPGYTMSQAINYINSKLPEVMKPDIRTAYSGKSQQFINSSGSMTGIMALAFVFIYLVLSAQFGSFLDPFIILLAVPLSMVGALLSLWLAHGTLNLYSQIGLVTLVGMISKHGILITQFINDLRREGMAMREAIVEGAMIRLRPVLMTTCAMIVGSLPLALASGPGSIGRMQIGWTIVGGLFFGTFFSLVVVPIAYSYLGALKKLQKSVA